MDSSSSYKEMVIGKIEELKPRLIELSGWLHDNPELGSEEYRAAELLSSVLEKQGFSVERNLLSMPTAFRASFHGRKDSPRIAFLAEYDALPGIGHACGHNIIGISAVGAGIATSELTRELGGTVTVLGCPAEEGRGPSASSKCRMVKEGIFEDIDFALMLHPFDNWATGSPALAVTGITVEFFGKTVNPAVAPEKGINALSAALIMFDAVDHMRAQLKREAHPVIYGIVKEGGIAPNVVPERVVCEFGVRTSEDSYLDELVKLIKNCARGASIATGAKARIRMSDERVPTKKHNKVLQEALYSNFKSLGVDAEPPFLSLSRVPKASTDFACVSHTVPSIEARVAIGPTGITTHTRKFERATISAAGQNALIIGTKILAMTAVDLLLSPEIRNKAWKSFKDG